MQIDFPSPVLHRVNHFLKMGLCVFREKSRWAFRSFCLHRRRLSPLPRPPLPAAAVTQPGRRRRNRLARPPPPRRRLAPATCQRQPPRHTAGAAAQSQRGVGGGRGRLAGGTMAAAAGGCAAPSPHPRPKLPRRGGYGARGFPTAAPRSAGRCRPAPLAAVAPRPRLTPARRAQRRGAQPRQAVGLQQAEPQVRVQARVVHGELLAARVRAERRRRSPWRRR